MWIFGIGSGIRMWTEKPTPMEYRLICSLESFEILSWTVFNFWNCSFLGLEFYIGFIADYRFVSTYVRSKCCILKIKNCSSTIVFDLVGFEDCFWMLQSFSLAILYASIALLWCDNILYINIWNLVEPHISVLCKSAYLTNSVYWNTL